MLTSAPPSCQIVTLTLPNGEVKADKIDCGVATCPLSDTNPN